MPGVEEDFEAPEQVEGPVDEDLAEAGFDGEEGDDALLEDGEELPAEIELVPEAAIEADEVEEDEEFDGEDVEASLDIILQQRAGGGRMQLEDDDEDVEEEREEPGAEGSERISLQGAVAPKRPGEFTCKSCFLVKHPSQLADAKRQLCLDCV